MTFENYDQNDKQTWHDKWQIQLEGTFKERSLRLLAFEAFDQSGEKTWPDLEKDKDNDNENDNNKYI